MTSQPRPQGLLLFQYGDGKRKVFFPAAAILEREKTLGTRLTTLLRLNAQDAIWSRLFVPSITRYLATGAFWVKLTAKHSVGARAFWFSIRSLNLLCTPKSFVIRSIRHNQSLLIKASSSETITIKVLEKKVNFMHLSENSRENRSFLLEKLAIVCIGMPQWWNRLRVNCHYTSVRNILSRLFILKLTVNCFFLVLNFFVNKLYSS